jgi:hypothetical protein
MSASMSSCLTVAQVAVVVSWAEVVFAKVEMLDVLRQVAEAVALEAQLEAEEVG